MSQPAVHIYQMGRVGSLTLKQGFVQAGFADVGRTHSHERAAELRQLPGNHVMFTGVREPLDRCVSAFFRNIANPANEFWFFGDEPTVMAAPLDQLCEFFLGRLERHLEARLSPWFERYEQSTGLSLHDFQQVGQHWELGLADWTFYIYKLESLDDFLAHLASVSRFSEVAFTTSNTGQQRWYAEKYVQFRQHMRLSATQYAAFVEPISWLNFFYADDEIRRLTATYVDW